MDKTLKKVIKYSKSQTPVEVVWLDITGEIGKSKDEIDNIHDLEELLCQCSTFGIIYKYDKNCIVLASEMSDSQVDCATIPIAVIKEIKLISNKKWVKHVYIEKRRKKDDR